jgi:hypothetical protein
MDINWQEKDEAKVEVKPTRIVLIPAFFMFSRGILSLKLLN